ncbi:uncharacterized protein LOC143044184 [Mytilus galloprovincialis]|uniref:uncharacterized protein LOC143044184 n=1 Tax=Mytilus galloprovincialis TaxID=29158 RepID=UPI003F7C74BC
MPSLRKVKDFLGNHRKFSSIQKILFLFLGLGILAAFSWKFMFSFLWYVLVIVSTIGVCQYLITSKHNQTFLLNIYFYLCKHEKVITSCLSLKQKIQEIFTFEVVEGEVLNDPSEKIQADEHERFYDAKDSYFPNEQEHYPSSMQLSDRSVATCTQVSWLEEVETIAFLIQKHFVHSWLKDFDPHIDVLTEYDKVLRDGIINFAYKLKKVDPSDLVKEICLNGCHHLRTLQTSRDKYKIQPRRRLSSGRRDSGSLSSLNRRYASVEEAFENISTYHIGIYDENENSYLFSICDIILNKAFSGIFLKSQVLNYILSEILTCNVLLPVLDLLSEPDFIYEKMIFILSDEALDIPVDEEDFVEEVNERFQIGDNQYYHDSSDNTSKHLGLRNENPPDTIENQTASSINFSSISQNGATEINCDEKFVPVIPMALIEPAATFSVSDSGQPSPVKTGSPVHKLNEMKASNPDFFLSCSDDDKPDMPDPYMNSLEIIETKPAIFLDVCIIDSEIRNESRSNSQFVLYVMQYDALYWVEAEKEPVLRTRQAKRRHREFINLHSRLEDNTLYKKSLKGVKGPKRWQTLPFGNLNKKSIEDRRKNLETYLKSLIQIDDICNGPELNEFLAYEGDGHIAFVRKTPENSMPRFDKMIVKTMSGVFDEIIKIPSRVNFPSLPGKKETNKEVEKNDCDLIAVDFDLNTKLQSLEEELQEYINSCDCPFFTSEDLPQNKLEETADQLSEEDISLAEAVVDIGVQTLQGKDNWVCRERVIIVMKRLIGVVLDRWFRDQITDLTSEQMCVKYLQLLRRTVWPDGELFEGGRPVKTDRQKAATKEQARRCLAQFFPDTLRRLVGKEDFDHGINEIIESLQYKKLNRHLIYTLMDQLMDSVYSETRDRKSST